MLTIYDADGRTVKTLLDEVVPAGSTALNWDGRNDAGATVTSGVYFYRLTAGSSALPKDVAAEVAECVDRSRRAGGTNVPPAFCYTARMKIYAGTSGYSYKEWKGFFYPEKMKPEEMLSFYATKLPAVEINNTFYRLPKRELIGPAGRHRCPRSFCFVSHRRRRKSLTCGA